MALLRKIRIALAVLFFIALLALLLVPASALRDWFGWMGELQLLPAVMAFALVPLCILFVLTLLLGRIYCSVICPLGVMQDGLSRLRGSDRFHFRREWALVRYGIWALFVLGLVFSFNSTIVWIAPYSTFGRIVSSLLSPLFGTGDYEWVAVISALVSLLAVGGLAILTGREWCNKICPVGTTLGMISRFSLFGPVILADKCRHCHHCEKHCKAGCISIPDAPKAASSATPAAATPAAAPRPRIDASRCVSCMDCLDQCPFGALKFKSRL